MKPNFFFFRGLGYFLMLVAQSLATESVTASAQLTASGGVFFEEEHIQAATFRRPRALAATLNTLAHESKPWPQSSDAFTTVLTGGQPFQTGGHTSKPLSTFISRRKREPIVTPIASHQTRCSSEYDSLTTLSPSIHQVPS